MLNVKLTLQSVLLWNSMLDSPSSVCVCASVLYVLEVQAVIDSSFQARCYLEAFVSFMAYLNSCHAERHHVIRGEIATDSLR